VEPSEDLDRVPLDALAYARPGVLEARADPRLVPEKRREEVLEADEVDQGEVRRRVDLRQQVVAADAPMVMSAMAVPASRIAAGAQ
jgi:hypothetical protein